MWYNTSGIGGNMWEEIVLMFHTMQWYIYIPLILGIVLMVFECIIPGFGILGISGLASIAGAIIAQGVLYKSPVQVLFLISICIISILLLFLIFIRSARFGIIKKTPFIQNKTALPEDYDDKKKNELSKLLGMRGVAITSMKPSGKFMIDDRVYQGVTAGEPIEKDDVVKVVDVEGSKIRVKKVEV